MMKLLGEIINQMENYEEFYGLRARSRKKADKETFDRIVEAIVCDLCTVALEYHYEALHLPLTNRVLRKASRYKGVALGRTLPKVLDVMASEEMDFLTMTKGKTDFAVNGEDLRQVPVGGTQTIIAARDRLLNRIKSFQITYKDIKEDEDKECIVLRATKTITDKASEKPGKLVEYEDTPETGRMRAELRAYNAWLDEADIQCSLPGVNTQRRHLQRICNNGDFSQGGRLYGGFWQPMSSDERLDHIMLNEDCCVELDYGQMSLMLYYAEARQVPPEGDLYDLSAYGIPKEYRSGIKKVTQAIINSQKEPSRFPKGTKKYLGKTKFREVLEAIKRKHQGIYPLMTSGVGMQMFRKESDILMAVLTEMRLQGITALPIHDAVIVADENKDQAKDIMVKVFQDHTGLIPQITEEYD